MHSLTIDYNQVGIVTYLVFVLHSLNHDLNALQDLYIQLLSFCPLHSQLSLKVPNDMSFFTYASDFIITGGNFTIVHPTQDAGRFFFFSFHDDPQLTVLNTAETRVLETRKEHNNCECEDEYRCNRRKLDGLMVCQRMIIGKHSVLLIMLLS